MCNMNNMDVYCVCMDHYFVSKHLWLFVPFTGMPPLLKVLVVFCFKLTPAFNSLSSQDKVAEFYTIEYATVSVAMHPPVHCVCATPLKLRL